MNAVGIQQINLLGKTLKRLGGLDYLYRSDLKRCVQTADILEKYMPSTAIKSLGHSLDPWHLGKFEGEPVAEVKEQIQHYIYNPEEKIPGRGFNADGESFDTFRERFLSTIEPLLYGPAKTHKIGVIGNYRTLALARSWILDGAKHSHRIVNAGMFQHIPTGDTLWISPFELNLETITDHTAHPLEFGLYMIRHGETDWNSSDQHLGSVGS